MPNEDIQKIIKSLPVHRQASAQMLFTKDWFKNTSPELQMEILQLPEDHRGFIADLSERPDEVGNVDILRLLKLNRGHFILTPIFEVRSEINNQIFTYEYASWKTGQHGGTRGIIFLETEGKITHFIVNRTHKFSTGQVVLDTIGGVFLRLENNTPVNFPQKLEQEICYHLGIKDLKFKKVIDLGRVYPDYGLTNNSSYLFAAIIDITDFPLQDHKPDFSHEHKPFGQEIQIVDIGEFQKYINKTEDNYFLGAAARILVRDDINLGI